MKETYVHHMGCILKVLIYIDEHLHEELPLKQLSKIACISSCYFHRLFRGYIGETLSEYITRLRIQRAQEKLQYSDQPITDIAFDIGYQTSSSFAKVFHQVMQESPSEYRKKMRPLMLAIMEKTHIKDKTMLHPQYIERKEEVVLFVRRTGDYYETPRQAFQALKEFIQEQQLTSQVKTYYGISLDDPNIVERSKCRFDACALFSGAAMPKGEIGKKTIPGGKFAVFIHIGPYSSLEETFTKIFREWYPYSSKQLADQEPFCEFLDMEDAAVSTDQKKTKLYIPIL